MSIFKRRCSSRCFGLSLAAFPSGFPRTTSSFEHHRSSGWSIFPRCCATRPFLAASAICVWCCALTRKICVSRRLRNHCNVCAARPRTCLATLWSSPRVLLHVDARTQLPRPGDGQSQTSGYNTGKKDQWQIRTTHKCTIIKCTILFIKYNYSISPAFTFMNPLLRLSYGQCSSLPNPLLRPSPSQCGSPPSSSSPSTNPNQISNSSHFTIPGLLLRSPSDQDNPQPFLSHSSLLSLLILDHSGIIPNTHPVSPIWLFGDPIPHQMLSQQ